MTFGKVTKVRVICDILKAKVGLVLCLWGGGGGCHYWVKLLFTFFMFKTIKNSFEGSYWGGVQAFFRL